MSGPACKGPGRFQWHAGGWFGAQIGGTVWLLLAAVIQLTGHAAAQGVALVCFLVANGIGYALYANRHRLAPYVATQALLGTIGTVSLVFAVYLNQAGLVAEVDDRLAYAEWGFYLLPLLFGGLMVWFRAMECEAVAGRSDRPAA